MKPNLRLSCALWAGIALSQTAFAAEMTLDQALKVADIHIKCAAYYKGGPGDQQQSNIHVGAARDLLLVHTAMSPVQARSQINDAMDNVIDVVKTHFGGDFDDRKLPTRFKTSCLKYDPSKNARYRVDADALAHYRAKQNPQPVRVAATPKAKPPTQAPAHEPWTPGIPLTIETGEGANFPVRIEITKSVADLKTLIAQSTGTPAQSQHLVYKGKRLQDSWLLLNYNIRKDATVQLVLAAVG